MLNTKLILIEGLPGAGKSTTTSRLGMALQESGIPCEWFLEDDDPHPISCLDFEIKGLPQKMIPLWKEFVDRNLDRPSVTILESRLWQNTSLYMLMSETGMNEILDYNHRLEQVLTPLSPALIYLDQPDVPAALHRMAAARGEPWVRATLGETLDYPWFSTRRIGDFDGWISFFKAWHEVAGQLYGEWPHHKVEVINPHENWNEAYNLMDAFLQIGPAKEL